MTKRLGRRIDILDMRHIGVQAKYPASGLRIPDLVQNAGLEKHVATTESQ